MRVTTWRRITLLIRGDLLRPTFQGNSLQLMFRGPATANISRGPAAADISRGSTAADISRGPAAADVVGGAMTNSMGRPAATSAAAMRGSIAANSVGGHTTGDGKERRSAVHNVAAGPAGGSPASWMHNDIYDSGMQGFDNEHQMDMEEAEMEEQQVHLV